MKLSVVIPCYNEEKNIPLVLARFSEVICREDIEIILVNNGSTDGSAIVLDRLLPHYPFARTVWVEKNQGYGYGILQGLYAAQGEFLGWTHADMQTDPNDVIQALAVLEQNGSRETLFVKGARKGRSFVDNFFSIGMALFETLYLGTILYEINAQPNIFSRRFFQSWQDAPHDFALDLYALYMAKKQKLDVRRIAVRFPERLYGKSSWNTSWRAKRQFIKRTLEFSVNLKKRGIR